MKIVYFIPHLREASGMNRVLSVKANYLAEVLKYEISIITYRQNDSQVFFQFSEKIKLVHLDIFDPSFTLKSLSFLEKRKQIKIFMNTYQVSIENYLEANKTDICIAMFLGAEYKFLHKIKDGSKKILEVHFNFDHSPFVLLSKPTTFQDLYARYQLQNLRKKLTNLIE